MRARREKRKLEQEHRRAAGHAVSAHSQLRPTTETRHGQDVGSSGSLLFHPARGAEIDRADLVVRFNDAPVEGFERFVGNRTDVRLNNTYAIGKVLAGCAKRGGGAPWTNQIPTAPKGGPSTCSAFLGFPKDNACCPREYMILNSGFGTYARCAQRLCPRSADARVLAGPAARSVKGRHAWMSGSLGMLALSKWCERGVTNLYGTSPARTTTTTTRDAERPSRTRTPTTRASSCRRSDATGTRSCAAPNRTPGASARRRSSTATCATIARGASAANRAPSLTRLRFCSECYVPPQCR